MNRFQKKFIYYLPHKMAHKIMYKLKYNETLDLKNPQTIDEKIHWLILNEYGNREAELTDKYLVRKYIKEKGYPYNNQYIIVYDNEMLIRDGQHRACSLKYLYGNIEVPIMRIILKK